MIEIYLDEKDYSYYAFVFNGKNSLRDYNLYRVSNDKSGFNENLTAVVKDQSASEEGLAGQRLISATHSQKAFNISVAFDSLSERQLQNVKKWLSEKDEKPFWFPETPHRVYLARVSGTPTFNLMPFVGDDGRRVYKGTGSIQFVSSTPYARTADWVVEDDGWERPGAGEIIDRIDGKSRYAYEDSPRNNDGSIYDLVKQYSYGEMAFPFIAKLDNFDYKLTLLSNNSYNQEFQQTATANGVEGGTISITRYNSLVSNKKFTTPTGQTFKYWNTKSDGSGTTYGDGAQIKLTGNTKLYAQWKIGITITFNSNYPSWVSKTNTTTTQAIEDGLAGGYLQARTFSDDNQYYFKNWNTAADGSGTSYNEGAQISGSENITLYAQWGRKYSITYWKVKSGSFTDSDTGNMEAHELKIDGKAENMEALSTFGAQIQKTVYAKEGATIYVRVESKADWPSDPGTCYIYGTDGTSTKQLISGTNVNYSFKLKANTAIAFQGDRSNLKTIRYWHCFINPNPEP